MTDSEMKALAEEKLRKNYAEWLNNTFNPTVKFTPETVDSPAEWQIKAVCEALSGTERFGLTENDIYSLVSRAQVAALKEDWQTPEEFTKKWLEGTERVECYLPTDEHSDLEVFDYTSQTSQTNVKKTTLTVVNPSKS